MRGSEARGIVDGMIHTYEQWLMQKGHMCIQE